MRNVPPRNLKPAFETEELQVRASPASPALCPSARHISPSLVLVQPRKTRPYITERLLMVRKESNQTCLFSYRD